MFLSARTNSISPLCTGLAQFTLTVFIVHLLFSSYKTEPELELRLAITLLLLSGYVFLEIYLQCQAPEGICSTQVLIVSSFRLAGHSVLLRLLPCREPGNRKFGSFPLPLAGINFLLLFTFSSNVLICLTGCDFLDTFLGLLMGTALLRWAGFTTLDAYRTIRETENG